MGGVFMAVIETLTVFRTLASGYNDDRAGSTFLLIPYLSNSN